MLAVRAARPDDYAFASDGVMRIIQMCVGSEDVPKLKDHETRMKKCFDEMLADDRHHVAIAEMDGKRVGLAILSFAKALHMGGWVCELQDLYVDKNARRGGVAKALLKHVEEVARRLGMRAVHLFQPPTGSEMHEERSLCYKRAGYKLGGFSRMLFLDEILEK